MENDVQQMLMQFQAYQQQMQNLVAQKEMMRLQKMEIERALEEMKKSKETHVFKITGPVLVKSEKATVENELNEKKESVELRIKSMEKEESKLMEKLVALQKELQNSQKSN